MMRDSLEITEAERSAYLARVLRLDPLYDADEIFRSRRKFLDLPEADSIAVDLKSEQHAERRRQARRKIAAVRKSFEHQKPEKICRQLEKLSLESFPDLQVVAHRLRTLAENSARLAALSSRPGFDDALRNQILKILLASKSEAGSLKGQVVFRMANFRTRNRLRKALHLLQAEVPDVYALERPWFEALLRMRKRDFRPPVQVGSEFQSETTMSFPGLILVLVSIVLALIGIIFGL